MEDKNMAHPDVEKILITEEEIAERCKVLGGLITQDYKDNPPVLVALLKGSVPFLAELMKHIDLDVQYDFMDVTSYAGTETTGEIKILKDLDTSVKGLDILLVEDIVDTGRTINAVMSMLKNKGANSVKIVTLLDKPSRRDKDVTADYIGFTVGNEFVVGFGMDYNQHYRCLPYIGVLKDECYS